MSIVLAQDIIDTDLLNIRTIEGKVASYHTLVPPTRVLSKGTKVAGWLSMEIISKEIEEEFEGKFQWINAYVMNLFPIRGIAWTPGTREVYVELSNSKTKTLYYNKNARISWEENVREVKPLTIVHKIPKQFLAQDANHVKVLLNQTTDWTST